MYHRILVPLDGSELSERVLPHAVEVAKRFGAELRLLQAVTPLSQIVAQTSAGAADATAMAPDITMNLASEQHEAEVAKAGEYLTAVSARLGTDDLRVRWEVASGAPADAVLKYVQEHQIDLVAMSTHGRGGLGRVVFGSVTDEVIRHSSVPILLIRPPAQH